VEPTDMPCTFARREKISIGLISAAPERDLERNRQRPTDKTMLMEL
jgi:hypothetical protein